MATIVDYVDGLVLPDTPETGLPAPAAMLAGFRRVNRSETRSRALKCVFVRRGIDDSEHGSCHDPLVRVPDSAPSAEVGHPHGAW